MHIDVMRVREQELDPPQSIVIARRLSHAEGNLAAIRPPIDRSRTDDLASGIDDLESFAIEVSAVSCQIRHHFVANDRLRYAPVRIDYNGFHFIAEYKSLSFGLADDNLRTPGNLVLLHQTKLERRLIYQDITLPDIARQPGNKQQAQFRILLRHRQERGKTESLQRQYRPRYRSCP